MIDPKRLRTDFEAIRENARNRQVELDFDLLLDLYKQKSSLQQQVEALRCRRNENAAQLKQKIPLSEKKPLIEEGKQLKEELAALEKRYTETETAFSQLIQRVPNDTHPDTPVGVNGCDSRELRRWGTPREFSFPAKDHVELGKRLDLFDFESGARVAGQKFYFLKNELVLLEFALETFALKKLVQHGFTPLITPDMARTEILEGIGFNPRGNETNIYSVENSDLCLVGTAEITLGGMYADRLFDQADLPILLCGFSHCFRTEAGAHGQFSRGLYRVHQFSKVEMFAFTVPEDSDTMHEKFLSIEEELYQELGIPYRVVEVCTGDLGNPAYRKFDIEAWMPGRGDGGEYGEITSASNCTDYQARRLNIRFKSGSGEKRFVHMLNGTAVAVSRALIAIMENYQNEDGSISVPEVLVPSAGFNNIPADLPSRH